MGLPDNFLPSTFRYLARQFASADSQNGPPSCDCFHNGELGTIPIDCVFNVENFPLIDFGVQLTEFQLCMDR